MVVPLEIEFQLNIVLVVAVGNETLYGVEGNHDGPAEFALYCKLYDDIVELLVNVGALHVTKDCWSWYDCDDVIVG